MAERFASVDGYIRTFPGEVQEVLSEIRRTILRVAPAAAEKISYNMPTMTLDGTSIVHFAGWKHHVSVYPAPAMDGDLARELAPYLASKGTLKFPLGKPIPYDLIAQVVTVLIAQRD